MTPKWTLTLLLAAVYTLPAAAQTRMDVAVERAVATASAQATQTDDNELSTRELIAAEEELASIRNTTDMYADFDKYPYLLDPEYRRADAPRQAQIRSDYQKGIRKPVASTSTATAQPTYLSRRAFLAESRDPGLLYQAEERLQLDKNAHSGRAEHDLDYYYNQLVNEYLSADPAFGQVTPSTLGENTLWEEYDPQFLYQAEERLQQDRNRHSGHAKHTLDYYYQQVISE